MVKPPRDLDDAELLASARLMDALTAGHVVKGAVAVLEADGMDPRDLPALRLYAKGVLAATALMWEHRSDAVTTFLAGLILLLHPPRGERLWPVP